MKQTNTAPPGQIAERQFHLSVLLVLGLVSLVLILVGAAILPGRTAQARSMSAGWQRRTTGGIGARNRHDRGVEPLAVAGVPSPTVTAPDPDGAIPPAVVYSISTLTAPRTLNIPGGVGVDAGGNAYVGDYGSNRVLQIAPDGITTVLSGRDSTGLQDGEAAQTQFNHPVGVAVDSHGNVYVTDLGVSTLRKISPQAPIGN